MNKCETYFLSSMESITFQKIRKCYFIKKITLSYGREVALVTIDPPVIGQIFNQGDDIELLILAARFEGDSLFPIKDYPCFIYIAIACIESVLHCDHLKPDQLKCIAWGEIYKSREAAEKNSTLE